LRTTHAEGGSSILSRARRTSLRFPDAELERQFLLSYRAAARPWIRVSLVVALSTVLGFTVIDHWLLVGRAWRGRTSGASGCSCRSC
jgi:hypothetical protein